MQVSKEQLMANLLAIRTTVENMMLLLNGMDAAPDGECQHDNRVTAMGGHWFCPDCGTEGREEQDE